MHRRTTIKLLGAGLAATGLTSAELLATAPAGVLPPVAREALRDLATVVLPASLGPVGLERVTIRFVAWLEGWEPGVPLEHGYGHPELRLTGASPAGAYVRQLEDLQAAARARGGALSALGREAQRALVDAALATAGVKGLPARPNGQHVASDLMAFHFRSSEANDVAYQAAIHRQVCRPLSESIRRPAPLKG